jgi:RNA polymerase nonessential primary-like sigma factor
MPAPVPPDLSEGLTTIIQCFSDDRLGLRLTPSEVHAAARAGVQAALDGGIRRGDVPTLLRHAERAIRDAVPGRHDRLVWRFARAQRTRLHGLDLDDLVQEGRIGLLEAARRYNPDLRVAGRPVRFSSYARHWIRLALRDALRSASHPIRLPAWVYTRRTQIRRRKIAPDKLTVRQRECLRKAVAARMLTESEVTVSAESRLPEPAVKDPEPTAGPVEIRQLEAVLAQLTTRQRAILCRRYGLGGREPATFTAIAAELGTTRENICQIAHRIEARLKGLMDEWGLSYEDFLS